MRKPGTWIVKGMLCLGLMLSFLPGAAAQTKEKVIELKFANFFPPPSKQSAICEEFIRDLEKRSGGRIHVRYFAGGSLLSAPNMYQGIEGGIADIGFSHVWYSPGRMPVTEAGGLPLACPSAWVGGHVMTDFYFKFRPKEWQKVKVLWFSTSGANNVISTKPVEKLEDLKGINLRAPGIIGEIVKALGATPTPTPMVEAYDATAKGVIDGVLSTYEVLKTYRFAEVMKNMTVSWHAGNVVPFYVAMNKNSYERLPEGLKEVLLDLCGEYRERFALMWNEIDFEGWKFGHEKGVRYIELSDEEGARWQKAAEPVVAAYVKRMVEKGFPEAEVQGWLSFLRERIDYYTKKQIEYRIPSATGPAAMRPENIGK